jgi:hypothetical protein
MRIGNYTKDEIKSIEDARDQHFKQAMRNGQLASEYKAQRDKLLTILTLVLDTHIYTGDDGEEASDNARLLIAEIEATK